jgi:pyridoxamine 5'-phosphate oxidase
MRDLAATLDAAWEVLEAGVTDRGAPARHVVLATTGTQGPEARLLVLRGADRAAGTLTLHSDAASAKVAELTVDPRAALLVWDPEGRVQIRLRTRVAVRPGGAADWSRLPDASRALYGGRPLPGAPIATPDAHRPAPDPARFAVLTATVHEIETLRLADPHERARFLRSDGFAGTWVAP